MAAGDVFDTTATIDPTDEAGPPPANMPDFARYIPTGAIEAADNQQKADEWAKGANQSLADVWAQSAQQHANDMLTMQIHQAAQDPAITDFHIQGAQQPDLVSGPESLGNTDIQPPQPTMQDHGQAFAQGMLDLLKNALPTFGTPSAPGANALQQAQDELQKAAISRGLPVAPQIGGNETPESLTAKQAESAQHFTGSTITGQLTSPDIMPPNPEHGGEAPPGSALEGAGARLATGAEDLAGAAGKAAEPAAEAAEAAAKAEPAAADPIQKIVENLGLDLSKPADVQRLQNAQALLADDAKVANLQKAVDKNLANGQAPDARMGTTQADAYALQQAIQNPEAVKPPPPVQTPPPIAPIAQRPTTGVRSLEDIAATRDAAQQQLAQEGLPKTFGGTGAPPEARPPVETPPSVGTPPAPAAAPPPAAPIDAAMNQAASKTLQKQLPGLTDEAAQKFLSNMGQDDIETLAREAGWKPAPPPAVPAAPAAPVESAVDRMEALRQQALAQQPTSPPAARVPAAPAPAPAAPQTLEERLAAQRQQALAQPPTTPPITPPAAPGGAGTPPPPNRPTGLTPPNMQPLGSAAPAPFTGPTPATGIAASKVVKGLNTIQGIMKQSILASIFHPLMEEVQLGRTAGGAVLGGDLGAAGKGIKGMASSARGFFDPAYANQVNASNMATILRAEAAGATGMRVGAQINPDAQAVANRLARTVLSSAGSGVVGYASGKAQGQSDEDALKRGALFAAGGAGLAQVTPVLNRMMWQQQIPLAKVEAFKMLESQYGAEVAAKRVNDTFGGQNLNKLARSGNFQTFLKTTFLSPDWLESWARNMGAPLGIGVEPTGPPVTKTIKTATGTSTVTITPKGGFSSPEAAAARRYWAATGISALVGLEGLNMALNDGQTTFQNEPGRQGQLEVTKIVRAMGGDPNQRYYADVLEMGPVGSTLQTGIRNVTRGADPGMMAKSMLTSHLNVVPGIASDALQNYAPTGGQIVPEHTPFQQAAGPEVAAAAGHVAPMGVSTFEKPDIPGGVAATSAATGVKIEAGPAVKPPKGAATGPAPNLGKAAGPGGTARSNPWSFLNPKSGAQPLGTGGKIGAAPARKNPWTGK